MKGGSPSKYKGLKQKEVEVSVEQWLRRRAEPWPGSGREGTWKPGQGQGKAQVEEFEHRT